MAAAMAPAASKAGAATATMPGTIAPSTKANPAARRSSSRRLRCRLCRQGVPETAYTVGLLSVLDAMMSRPMADLVDELPLPEEVKRAIALREGPYGRLLDHAFRIERNEWPQDTCEGITKAALIEAYAASSEAAFSTMDLIDDN